MAATSIDLQLSLQCAACGVVVPINAFVPELVCWSCERRTALDETAWRRLLDEPLRTAGAAGAAQANVEHATTLQTESGTFHRVFHLGAPACGACRGPLVADELRALALGPQGASGGRCPRCNERIALRPAPPLLARAGLVAVAGEADGRREHAPVALACTACGASLSVDGTSRVVACGYCHATQYLPNELFLRLRSVPVTQWSLLLAEAAASLAQGGARPLAAWKLLYDLVADARGNLFAWGLVAKPTADAKALRDAFRAGEAPIGGAIWSMGPDMTLRWMREGLPFHSFATRLAVTPQGHVLVWDERSALVVQGADGATVYRYSGQPGEGHALETQGATSLAVDADGSVLLLSEDERLLRTDWAGQPVATWGEGPRARAPGKPGEAWVRTVTKKPLRVYHAAIAAGWDRNLYVQSTIIWEGDCHVASFDRAGKRLYLGQCTVGEHVQTKQRPAVDGRGSVYVLAKHVSPGGMNYTVHRVEPGGARAGVWITPRARGGLLGEEALMTCAADGTLFVAGNGGLLRRFGADARVQFVSPESAASDERAGARA